MSRSRHSPKYRPCGSRCSWCWPDGSYKLAKAPEVDPDEYLPHCHWCGFPITETASEWATKYLKRLYRTSQICNDCADGWFE